MASFSRRPAVQLMFHSFLCGVLVLACTIVTFKRNTIWEDSHALLGDTLGKSPNKARPHFQLGYVYGRENRIEDAIRAFQRALGLAYVYPDAHYNLGIALRRIGRYEEAVREFEITVQIDPHKYPNAHYHLGKYFLEQERFPDAERELAAYIKQKPFTADARNDLGRIYLQAGRYREAITEFETALALVPSFSEAKANLDRAHGLLRSHGH